jgi:hypothetical protein
MKTKIYFIIIILFFTSSLFAQRDTVHYEINLGKNVNYNFSKVFEQNNNYVVNRQYIKNMPIDKSIKNLFMGEDLDTGELLPLDTYYWAYDYSIKSKKILKQFLNTDIEDIHVRVNQNTLKIQKITIESFVCKNQIEAVYNKEIKINSEVKSELLISDEAFKKKLLKKGGVVILTFSTENHSITTSVDFSSASK